MMVRPPQGELSLSRIRLDHIMALQYNPGVKSDTVIAWGARKTRAERMARSYRPLEPDLDNASVGKQC